MGTDVVFTAIFSLGTGTEAFLGDELVRSIVFILAGDLFSRDERCEVGNSSDPFLFFLTVAMSGMSSSSQSSPGLEPPELLLELTDLVKGCRGGRLEPRSAWIAS